MSQDRLPGSLLSVVPSLFQFADGIDRELWVSINIVSKGCMPPIRIERRFECITRSLIEDDDSICDDFRNVGMRWVSNQHVIVVDRLPLLHIGALAAPAGKIQPLMRV